mmetsp:Transcript_15635/g.33448  ORF Transcript_15635/g.33448 Transcript_15635/m.33448 type:complete len:264 (-) Transcript_15635:724-1515(-)
MRSLTRSLECLQWQLLGPARACSRRLPLSRRLERVRASHHLLRRTSQPRLVLLHENLSVHIHELHLPLQLTNLGPQRAQRTRRRIREELCTRRLPNATLVASALEPAQKSSAPKGGCKLGRVARSVGKRPSVVQMQRLPPLRVEPALTLERPLVVHQLNHLLGGAASRSPRRKTSPPTGSAWPWRKLRNRNLKTRARVQVQSGSGTSASSVYEMLAPRSQDARRHLYTRRASLGERERAQSGRQRTQRACQGCKLVQAAAQHE